MLSLMDIRILRATEIMFEDRGWTRGRATCSFDDVPKTAPGWLDMPPLRLAGLQEIDAGAGYPMHRHEDVETITIMLAGTLAHDDDIGGAGETGPEDVAVVSAGSGMQHAEIVTKERAGRAVIFWLRSAPLGAPPRFTKRTFPRTSRRDALVTVASGHPTEGAIPIRQNASVLTSVLSAGAEVVHTLGAGRRAYLFSTDAPITIGDHRAEADDRVLVTGPGAVHIRALAPTEIMLVDL
jgi:redox-sensitive bicupin YhaK (pirin superfamily)